MPINFNNPALANTYSNLLADIRDMQTALATMNFTGATGTPSGTISWSTTNNRFERWNGSAWAAAMPDASTSVRGPVLLNDSVISTSTALGATANAVKTAYDAAVLAASTTQSGRVELATDAETQTGTDAVRAVTPAGLRACTATETRIGVVELATNAEAIAGTDTARAVTPAGLAAAIAAGGGANLNTRTLVWSGSTTSLNKSAISGFSAGLYLFDTALQGRWILIYIASTTQRATGWGGMYGTHIHCLSFDSDYFTADVLTRATNSVAATGTISAVYRVG